VAIEAVGVYPRPSPWRRKLCAPVDASPTLACTASPSILALNELWIKNIDISMGLVNTNTLGMLLKLVTQKQLPVEGFVTQKFSFDQILDAYDVFGNASKYDALKVLIH
jgi:alcohol dehydrogenase